MWNNFKTKKVWENTYETPTKKITFWSVLKYIIVVICILAVIFLWVYLVKADKIKFPSIWKATVNIISEKFGEEMQKDEYWNVNVLLVWVGWDGHQWWYLSDTIIVASRNQELWAVTMISVPRDLYVKATWYVGKINWLFARGYGYNKDKSISWWVQALWWKLEDMMWLKIPYYAVIDFKWFKEVVDTLSWVEIDVPYTIHDTTYPDEHLWYETFHIWAWLQTLDGDTALKYARSRHTTSDFSRSQRQQQLIKAITDKLLQKENLTNIDTLRELYDTYTRMVKTNISSKEMIWAVKYASNQPKIFSFGLNTYCTYSSYKLTDAGCFLYNGNRDAFNGLSVIIPNGWTASNVSFYDYIRNFASFVMHDQWYLVENPRIIIKNAIDKSYASKNGKSPTWWAMKVAVKMKKYWFNIAGTENSNEPYEYTTAVVYGDDYQDTIRMLQNFFPITVVMTWQVLTPELTWENLELTEEEIQEQQDLWYEMELYIWNDFIDYVKENPFSYEK